MASTPTADLIINGAWRAPSGERYDDVANPASPDETVGLCAAATREDTREAIQAAADTQPSWWDAGFPERADALRRMGEATQDDTIQERAELLTRENGKTLKESKLEMTRLDDRFNYTASLAPEMLREDAFEGPPHRTKITMRPMGVAALIIPYNWPLSILGAKLPQALLAGNTVVIKPPPTAPLATVFTLKLMADALPPGVLNVVSGPVDTVGTEFMENRTVRKIDFTGSVEAGRKIMADAAPTLKDITLELGGNDAGIVLDDAQIDDAALTRMVMGAFLSAGQICMALKRLYVHRSLFDRVHQGLGEKLDGYVVGDGMAEDSTMGPLNSKKQYDIVRELIDDARQRGATVQEHGSVRDEEEFRRGWFQRPTLVTDVEHGFRVVDEEQFGPVLPIMAFDDEDEAVRLANDSEFGLCSSVWSADVTRAERVGRRLDAGYTYINGHGPMAQDNRAPFGGVKQSGVGRQLGKEGVLRFMEYHSMSSPA